MFDAQTSEIRVEPRRLSGSQRATCPPLSVAIAPTYPAKLWRSRVSRVLANVPFACRAALRDYPFDPVARTVPLCGIRRETRRTATGIPLRQGFAGQAVALSITIHGLPDSACPSNMQFPQNTLFATLCGSTVCIVPFRNISTFHYLKIQNSKIIIHQCLRAFGGNLLKRELKVNKGNQAQKNFEIFSGHFDGKTLANQRKNIKKHVKITQKNRVF